MMLVARSERVWRQADDESGFGFLLSNFLEAKSLAESQRADCGCKLTSQVKWFFLEHSLPTADIAAPPVVSVWTATAMRSR